MVVSTISVIPLSIVWVKVGIIMQSVSDIIIVVSSGINVICGIVNIILSKQIFFQLIFES